jgi:hypothetical protein
MTFSTLLNVNRLNPPCKWPPSLSQNSLTFPDSYKLSTIQPTVRVLSISSATQVRMNSRGVLSMKHRVCQNNLALIVDFYMVPMEEEEDNEMSD